MYATAHWDLVEATHRERLAAAHTPRVASEASVTPGRVTTWGPRASRVAELVARIIRIPEPRPVEADDVVLLDA